ncbi:NMDA receptor synaptonuclear signaling and neuronal migration factor-like isoform X1 [Crassostrea virginica]|uniref:NMDA receptor synaptonuclear signaling and neuronal migration factor-like n=1 Tax=Crassostrea virginica TaxID=6565 RepID=A0A8B8DKG1_CRAVI|nr:NMDA receptor synaptonuclear signaling and neuronal migration factor-like [Crassostrea virginica]
MQTYGKYEHFNRTDLFNKDRKMAKIKVLEMFDGPKQFMVTSETYADEIWQGECGDYDDSVLEKDQSDHSRLKFQREATMDAGLEDFDLDFMMPARVREILSSEGLPKDVIDKSVKHLEKKHRRALHMTILQEKSQRSSADPKTQKTKKNLSLPRLQGPEETTGAGGEHSAECECCHDVAVRREKRHQRLKPWSEATPVSEMITETVVESPVEPNPEESFEFCLTEAEKVKWLSEQQFEKALVGSNFEPPRLVLISSKIPKHHVIPKMLLTHNVVHIVYDFEIATFNEILEMVSGKLESIKSGCKAKSILLLCQGGPGYLYILRKFAVTPQKLKKESYKCVREFWRTLSSHVSKIDQSESAIHISGCTLEDSFQGREVVRFIQRLVQPNMVRISANGDQSEKGQKIISHYFNVTLFNYWKAHMDDSDDELDLRKAEVKVTEREQETDVRSWSSLAKQFESD